MTNYLCDTVPEGNRIILSDEQINRLTAATYSEIIDRLNDGENLAFLKLNDDGSIDLTIYFLSMMGDLDTETESVFDRTERYVKIAPKEKKSLLHIKDEYGLYRSVFTLQPDTFSADEVKGDNIDLLADAISKIVAERLEKVTCSRKESEIDLPEYVVFLSYSSGDKDEARNIQEFLEQNDVSCFIDEKSIKPGDEWEDSIRTSIKNCEYLILLITPDSLKSEWVLSEWAIAWALEKPIIPVVLRCDYAQLPQRLKRYHAINYHELDKLIGTVC